MNYVSNWYCLDLLSCLPYDIIYFVLDGLKPDDENENDSNASATSLFSALKGTLSSLDVAPELGLGIVVLQSPGQNSPTT